MNNRKVPEHVFLTSKVIWAQIDSNNHLRHSAFSDFASQARVEAMMAIGFDIPTLTEMQLGPILFSEELIYKREVAPNETIMITCEMASCTPDGAKWAFYQEVYREDGRLAAVVKVTGAWIHREKRKLAIPPKEMADKFIEGMPRTKDFTFN